MKLVILEDNAVLDASGTVLRVGRARTLPVSGGLPDRALFPVARGRQNEEKQAALP